MKNVPLILFLLLVFTLLILLLIGLMGDHSAIREQYGLKDNVKLEYVWIHMYGKNVRVYTDGKRQYIVGGFGPWRSIARE